MNKLVKKNGRTELWQDGDGSLYRLLDGDESRRLTVTIYKDSDGNDTCTFGRISDLIGTNVPKNDVPIKIKVPDVPISVPNDLAGTIIDLYKSGKTSREITEITGIEKRKVLAAIKSAGVVPHKKGRKAKN